MYIHFKGRLQNKVHNIVTDPCHGKDLNDGAKSTCVSILEVSKVSTIKPSGHIVTGETRHGLCTSTHTHWKRKPEDKEDSGKEEKDTPVVLVLT